jgi:hypothetical protein
MPEIARIDTLKNQHRQLQAKIELESNRPLPDDLLVAKLKREKLKVKDELAHLHAI